MATYRSHTPNLSINPQAIQAMAGGHVSFDVFIQIRTSRNPDNWADVPGGHRTLVLEADALLAITDDPNMSNAQKRQALRAAVQAEAALLKIDPADEATTETAQILNLATTDLDITLRDV